MRWTVVPNLACGVFGFMALVVFGLGVKSAQPPNDPKPKSVSVNVKDKTETLEALTVTHVELDAVNLRGLCWADPRGEALIALSQTGMVRRVDMASFKETLRVELKRDCSGLAMSSQGLVVAATSKEVILLDPGSLRVKRTLATLGVGQVAAVPGSGLACAVGSDKLYVLDLAGGQVKLHQPRAGEPKSLADPVLTPDGRYLFARSRLDQKIHRFQVTADGVMFEQSSLAIARGDILAGVQVSPDGRYVCLPCQDGNQPNLPDHPIVGNHTTYVYPVRDLLKPAFVLKQGPCPRAVAFDPVTSQVYSQNDQFPLMVFTDKGASVANYKLNGGMAMSRQFLVHPEGRRLFQLTARTLKWVELPAK